MDVSVVDRNGRPVPDLTAQDFTLSVDGKPRQIASAEFISIAATPEAVPARAAEYSSNAGAAGGRLIMLVVDSGNIGIGRGKTAFEAARRFIGTLNRADRVALVVLPRVGPQVEFTTNHALVQSLLEKVAGQGNDDLGPRRVTVSEALALQGNDRTAVRDVVARECSTEVATTLIESCLQRIQGEAGQLLLSLRERSRNSLVILRAPVRQDGHGQYAEDDRPAVRGHAARFASPTSRGSAPAPRPRRSFSTSCSSTTPRSMPRPSGCRRRRRRTGTS